MTKKGDLQHIGDDLRSIERIFKERIEPYRSDLWRYCYKLSRSPWDAEDLVQDTLLKSFANLTNVYQSVQIKSYLFRIATNLWIDQFRKEKKIEKKDTYPLEFLHDANTTHEYNLIENLESLIQQLTPTQYVTLLLSDVFLFKAKETAEIIGSTESAVYTNLERARKILRDNKQKSMHYKRVSSKGLNTNQIIDIFIEGFRNKDPEQIASVLDEHLVTDIRPAGVEYGKEETKKNSLNDWKGVVDGQQTIIAQYKELWGRPVIIELEQKEDGDLYLNNIHYLHIEDGSIVLWKFYCFSWDLMNHAAEELDVFLNAEYFYHIF